MFLTIIFYYQIELILVFYNTNPTTSQKEKALSYSNIMLPKTQISVGHAIWKRAHQISMLQGFSEFLIWQSYCESPTSKCIK